MSYSRVLAEAFVTLVKNTINLFIAIDKGKSNSEADSLENRNYSLHLQVC